jgi:hypothetical protein
MEKFKIKFSEANIHQVNTLINLLEANEKLSSQQWTQAINHMDELVANISKP